MKYANNYLGFGVDLPSTWREGRRGSQRTNPEFFGPGNSTIKIASGPVPPTSPESQQRKLVVIADRHGHEVLTTETIEVGGHEHAVMRCQIPGIGIVTHYGLIFGSTEYLITAAGDQQECESIVLTFSLLPRATTRSGHSSGGEVRAILGDFWIWTIPHAVAWGAMALFPLIVLYVNVDPKPTTAPTRAHNILVLEVVGVWAAAGGLLGLFGLFRYCKLRARMGDNAWPAFMAQTPVLAILAGSLLGALAFPLFDPPPGALLRSVAWRIPICATAAFVASAASMRLVGFLGKRLR